MDGEVRVHIEATPPLLAELVQRAVLGGRVTLSESDCQVSIATPDHAGEALGRIVIVLGDSVEGDVRVIVDGFERAVRSVRAHQLHDLVIDLADGVGQI